MAEIDQQHQQHTTIVSLHQTQTNDASNNTATKTSNTTQRNKGHKRPSLTVASATDRPLKRQRRWCDVVDKLSLQHGVETDAHRLAQRQKQIDYGKNTLAYDKFIARCPRHARNKGDPMTPVVNQKCSKRSFLGQVTNWKKKVYDYVDALEEDELKQAKQKLNQLAESISTSAASLESPSCSPDSSDRTSDDSHRRELSDRDDDQPTAVEKCSKDTVPAQNSKHSLDSNRNKPSNPGTDVHTHNDDEKQGIRSHRNDHYVDEHRLGDMAGLDMMDVDFFNQVDDDDTNDIQLDDQGNVIPSTSAGPDKDRDVKEEDLNDDQDVSKERERIEQTVFDNF